jgi:hypothetical protein
MYNKNLKHGVFRLNTSHEIFTRKETNDQIL